MGRDRAIGLGVLRSQGRHTIAQDAESRTPSTAWPKAAAKINAAVDILRWCVLPRGW